MKRTTIGLVILGALTLAAALVSPLASESPDGLEAALERAAEGSGEPAEVEHLVDSPWPDYGVGGDETTGSTILAGVLGGVITLAVGWIIARLLLSSRGKA